MPLLGAIAPWPLAGVGWWELWGSGGYKKRLARVFTVPLLLLCLSAVLAMVLPLGP